MFNVIKDNLFIILATLFLGVTLAFSFTANGQTSGNCEACGGVPDSGGDCYAVDSGVEVCLETTDGCSQGGGSCGGEMEEN